MQKAANLEKAPALLLEPPWALEEKCFFLRSLHLPEQPTVVKGTKSGDSGGVQEPTKTLAAIPALWKALGNTGPVESLQRKTEASSSYQFLPV